MLYTISDMYFMFREAEIEWEEDRNEEYLKAEIFTRAWLLRNAPPKWTSLILLILNIMAGSIPSLWTMLWDHAEKVLSAVC